MEMNCEISQIPSPMGSMDCEGCRIGHPSQSEHDCCGYGYYNFGFGSPSDEDDSPNNDDKTDEGNGRLA